jgi:predicted phage-related endonuclease
MTIERIAISDREQWLKLRQQDVTASAAGALLGVHEFVTPFGLWALKSGQVVEDPEETGAMKRGRLLEPVAVELLKEQHPDWMVQHGGFYLRDPEARLGATPDLFVDCPVRGRGIVQIKSVEGSIFRKKWKQDGEATPPLWIAVQGILEAYLAGAKWASVAALVVGFGIDLHVVDVPIHPGVIDNLKAKTAEFWKLVETNTPPPVDFAKDGETLAKLYAETNGEVLDLTTDNHLPALCEEDEALAAAEKTATERRKAIRNEIIAKLGNAAGATCQGWSISAKTSTRKEYTVKATTSRTVRKTRINQQESAA